MKKILLIFLVVFVGAKAWAGDNVKPKGNDKQRPLSFYFGVGGNYFAPSSAGLAFVAGAIFHRHDLQLGYTLGLSKSDAVHWYNDAGVWQSSNTFQQRSFAVRYGYQLNLKHGLCLTPQAGYTFSMLQGNLKEGSVNYGDGAKASCLALGVKLTYVPVKHCKIFLIPEYSVAVSQDTYYKHTADYSNYSPGGFAVSVGVMFSY